MMPQKYKFTANFQFRYMPHPNKFQNVANQFVSEETKLLFITESPPESIEQYFYYPEAEDDWLWIGLMKAIYGEKFKEIEEERPRKKDWLTRFQFEGYRLIEAVKEPISDDSLQARIEQIKNHLDEIVEEIWEINPNQILLIKTTVYDALYSDLKDFGLPVIDSKLAFPVQGRQKEFQEKFKELVESGEIFLTHLGQ